jgi:hypothetical protein
MKNRKKGYLEMKKFNPSSTHPLRALQAWQILVSAAMNRQILTYQLLSEKMYGKPASGVLDKILGHIAFFCKDNKLPPITAIVVNKGKGKPGKAIPTNLTKIDENREKVYQTNWFDIIPPTPKQLETSFSQNT